MKVLFQGKRSFLKPLGSALFCIVLSLPALAQDGPDSHKFLYGIHLGFTENKVDIYSSQGGTLHTDGDHSFYNPGFRIAVIGDAQLGRCFSLRAMPGLSLFRSLKLESVCGELPVDVKFHPIRTGNLRPYLTTGLGYGFDFASLRDDSHNLIKPLSPHDLRYTCGLGVDWHTRFVRVGFELKAGIGLLPPGNGGSNNSYFHHGPSFSFGINIEA